ncbi:MAG: ribonuclease P protein component [Ruminococcaceae bacterium]|nr:ribonuclease P protein component [Oscillospiraceae bacterium]MBQ2916510.1 ribonuclease P protein component [Clostridia bacterium]
MKNTETITENKIFTRLYGKGRTAVSGSAVVYYRQNNLHKNRLGLTSTKKIGCAVKRNRARRVIREAYRLLEDRLKVGYDIVIVARTKATSVTMFAVKSDLERAFRTAGLIRVSENDSTDTAE